MNAIVLAIVSTATDVPQPNFDENTVTPGWVGFAVTFGVAVLIILLCIDLVRRIRRVRYRGEIREQLEAERRENGRADGDEPHS